jgi:hypothetical protein
MPQWVKVSERELDKSLSCNYEKQMKKLEKNGKKEEQLKFQRIN